MKRERIGGRDSSCSRCVAEADGCSRMKIAFWRCTRARPVRSLVDLISYAELSSRSMQVAPLFSFSVSLYLSLLLSLSFYSGSSFPSLFVTIAASRPADRLLLALKNRTFS